MITGPHDHKLFTIGFRIGLRTCAWVKTGVKDLVLCRFIRIFVLEFIIRNNIMPEFDIALELARLHILSGADFVQAP